MFYDNYKTFLDNIFTGFLQQGIDAALFDLDHIAYQVSSGEEYDEFKPRLLSVAELVKEPLVDGRRVGVFMFRIPLLYKDYQIKTIELIAPVAGKTPKSELDHAEFLTGTTLEEFIAKYPRIPFDLGNLNRKEFPMIKLSLPNGSRVKFPRYPILADTKT